MIFSDYHTHTIYSHGKMTPQEVVKAAYEKGLETIAISEHAKGNMFYGLSDNDFYKLSCDIKSLKAEYSGKINVLLGIEADFMGKGKCDIPGGIDFDILLIGYHRGIFPGNKFAFSALMQAFTKYTSPQKNTDEYLRTLDNYPKIYAITHPCEYIRIDVKRLAKEAAKRNVLLEINNRHVTLSCDELKIAADEGAKFIISSDGHTKDEMCRFDNAMKVAKEAGVLPLVTNYKE